MQATLPAKLIEYTEIAPEVRHFVFEAVGMDDMKFTPGQFVALSDMIGDKKITRAYSIASAPASGNRFELCINLVPDGKFTPRLFALQPGESVTMQPPLGGFILRKPVRDSVMIATGTGVAPFRSMLRNHFGAGDGANGPRFDLLFGVRHEPHLYYRDEFEKLQQEQPGRFQFWPTVTRPEPGYTGPSGRVTAHLEQVIQGRRDIDVYLCGLKEMVNDVRQTLLDQGFDKSQVKYERYD
ncbi:MAG: FAD-binding oxidoreductase [Bryobacteraceae bacterium]